MSNIQSRGGYSALSPIQRLQVQQLAHYMSDGHLDSGELASISANPALRDTFNQQLVSPYTQAAAAGFNRPSTTLANAPIHYFMGAPVPYSPPGAQGPGVYLPFSPSSNGYFQSLIDSPLANVLNGMGQAGEGGGFSPNTGMSFTSPGSNMDEFHNFLNAGGNRADAIFNMPVPQGGGNGGQTPATGGTSAPNTGGTSGPGNSPQNTGSAPVTGGSASSGVGDIQQRLAYLTGQIMLLTQQLLTLMMQELQNVSSGKPVNTENQTRIAQMQDQIKRLQDEYNRLLEQQRQGSTGSTGGTSGSNSGGQRPDSGASAPPATASQPTTSTAPQPTTSTAPQPTTNTAPQPTTNTAPQPTTTTAPQPTTNTAPQPAAAAQPAPTVAAKPVMEPYTMPATTSGMDTTQLGADLNRRWKEAWWHSGRANELKTFMGSYSNPTDRRKIMDEAGGFNLMTKEKWGAYNDNNQQLNVQHLAMNVAYAGDPSRQSDMAWNLLNKVNYDLTPYAATRRAIHQAMNEMNPQQLQEFIRRYGQSADVTKNKGMTNKQLFERGVANLKSDLAKMSQSAPGSLASDPSYGHNQPDAAQQFSDMYRMINDAVTGVSQYQ